MDNFEEILPRLVQIQLFSDFNLENEEDKRILKAIYGRLEKKCFRKGETIIREGEYGDLFFILLTGEVQIERGTPAGDTIALARLKAEQNIFFGETALISNDPRSATVKAATDCTTIALSSQNFLKLSQMEPVFGYRVLLQLARRMAKTVRDTNTDKATLYEALFSEIEGDL